MVIGGWRGVLSWVWCVLSTVSLAQENNGPPLSQPSSELTREGATGAGEEQTQKVAHLARVLKLEGQKHEISRIFIFGDSLSDTSNIHKKSRGLFPPSPFYWRGRFADGPTWSEFVGESLGVEVHNFAEAGARAQGLNHFYVLPPFLRHLWVQEVDSQFQKFIQGGFTLSSQDLVVVWIGGNDHLLFPGHDPLDQIVGRIKNLLTSLQDRGAQKIMVFNLPDVSVSPFHGLGVGRLLMRKHGIKKLIEEHNSMLHSLVETMRTKHPEVAYFEVDIYGVIARLIRNASQYGFEDTKFPCLGRQLIPAPGVFRKFFDADALPWGVCSHPGRFFFWDPWHPSSKVHCLTAVHVVHQMGQESLLGAAGLAVDRDVAEKACL